VEADRVQIERMITNLLSNALKFTPVGGEVRLSA
jgi:signal transduction histidine kinase